MLFNTFSCSSYNLEIEKIREWFHYLTLAYRTRSLISHVLWVLLKVPKAYATRKYKASGKLHQDKDTYWLF